MNRLAWFPFIMIAAFLAACGSGATSAPSAAEPPPTAAKASDPMPTLGVETLRPGSAQQTFTIQFACGVPARWCEAVESVFAPMVAERSNGRIDIRVSVFHELNLSFGDVAPVLRRGTVGMAEVFGTNLWSEGAVEAGLSNFQTMTLNGPALLDAVISASDDLDKVVTDVTGGVVLFRLWRQYGLYFWTNAPLLTRDDFVGKTVMPLSLHSSLVLQALGAQSPTVLVDLQDTSDALRSGALDVLLCSLECGKSQRYSEVTKYLVGPIPNRGYTWGVINGELWDRMPPDLQQVLREVGEEFDRDILHLSEEWGKEDLASIESLGMEVVELTPELAEALNLAAIEGLRLGVELGGPDHPWVRIWNEHFAPRLGLRIEPDGSVVEVPVVTE